jgi:hypothetical protein
MASGLSFSLGVLIAANLVPLAGALFAGWSVYEIILLFWAENLVIGVFQVARMLAVMGLKREPAMLMVAAFFVAHFGGFPLGHGFFVVGILSPAPQDGLEGAAALLLAPAGLLVPLLALTASHGFSFVMHFLRGGEWREPKLGELIFGPYLRVVVLHLVIIAGGALVLAFDSPTAALALLAVLKLVTEIPLHLRAHRATAPPAANAPSGSPPAPG